MKTYEEEHAEFKEAVKDFVDAAFPVRLEFRYKSRPDLMFISTSKGLSKREYFAAQALQHWQKISHDTDYNYIARRAVEQADALIAELNK